MVVRGDISDYFSVHEYGKTTPKKVYLFGGWGGKAIFYRPLLKELVNGGYAVVLFMPKRRLVAVGTPYEEIVTASRLVCQEVAHRIRVDAMIGVRGFAGFGIGFGTIFGMEAAKNVPAISRLVLLSPFGDFARHVELWPQHFYFKKVLSSQPTDRIESGRVLNKVGVAQRVDGLRGKKVLICYSDKDRIIHSDVTAEMVRLLNRSHIDVETAVVHGGHVRGIITALLVKKAYKKFLHLEKSKNKPSVPHATG